MAINQDDFLTPLTGNITIVNNGARLTVQANADLNTLFEGDETFRLRLRRGSNTGPIVATTTVLVLRDTSNTITYDSLVESADTIAEGGTVSFVLNTTNLGPNNTLYYNTVGNAASALFASGNTGSFITTGNSYTLEFTTTSTVPDNETRYFQLEIKDSASGSAKITSNVINVVDSLQAFVSAEGGFVTINEGYKIHTFTSSNTFNITGLGIPVNRTIEYLIAAGGGGGNGSESFGNAMGGGGAGGVLQGTFTATSGANAFVIGAGGAGSRNAQNGSNTRIYGIEAVGGGKGSRYPDIAAGIGGSGGGGSGGFPNSGPHAIGGSNILLQGNPGGVGIYRNTPFSGDAGGGGGGGGGAGARGANAIITPSTWQGGLGGAGIYTFITTANIALGGGGGGGTSYSAPGLRSAGGIGGGGPGANGNDNNGAPGTVNTGGGGGGSVSGGGGGSGGSGVIYVRYPYTVETYRITADNNGEIGEGSNITFSLSTINVSNNTVLYYSTSGNVTTSDFIGGNTGTITVVSSNSSLTLRVANNIISGSDTKEFTLQLKKNSQSGTLVASANTITIYSYTQGYISGSGGNSFISGDYVYHIFTESNTFNISATGDGYSTVDYLVVAGGGGGLGGAGAGAGGLLTGQTSFSSPDTLIVTVGAGGASSVNGSNSSITGTNFSNLISYGGGTGNQPGGSGGAGYVKGHTGGTGVSGQGNPGGAILDYGGGSILRNASGGGAQGAGGSGNSGNGDASGGPGGGSGRPISWIPASYGTSGPAPGRWFAGGGGAAGGSSTPSQSGWNGGGGGTGGGGRGSAQYEPQPPTFTNGTTNTGGGGGGGGGSGGGGTIAAPAGTGGSGIIAVRFRRATN